MGNNFKRQRDNDFEITNKIKDRLRHGDKALTFTDYDISSVFCSETTNNSAIINVRLNNVATVQKWTYFLSKDKSQVEKVDGTQGSTHKTVARKQCIEKSFYKNLFYSQSFIF